MFPEEKEKAFAERELYETFRRPQVEPKRPQVEAKRKRRSVSVERNVEVLVVADQKMVDYYSNEDLNNYILTVMNMVGFFLTVMNMVGFFLTR